MDQTFRAISAFVASIIGLAIFSVILSRQSNTAGVLLAGGRAFSGVLQAATAPVTGGAAQGGGVIYPGQQGGAAAYGVGLAASGAGNFIGGLLSGLGAGYGGGYGGGGYNAGGGFVDTTSTF